MIRILKEDDMACAFSPGETEEEKVKLEEFLAWRRKPPVERIEIRAAKLQKEGYKIQGKLEQRSIPGTFSQLEWGIIPTEYTLIMVKEEL